MSTLLDQFLSFTAPLPLKPVKMSRAMRFPCRFCDHETDVTTRHGSVCCDHWNMLARELYAISQQKNPAPKNEPT